MAKVEPMSEDEIITIVDTNDEVVRRLILAYAHAQADAERPHGVTKEQQLAIVLARIGWRE